MGYYTTYDLEIDNIGENLFVRQCEHDNPSDATFCMTCGKQIRETLATDIVWDYIASAPELENLRYAVGAEGEGGNSCKWYKHKEDMKALSAKFPGILFTLHGEGEESEDLWVQYWLGGKCQEEKAQVVFGSFDESKLR